jgi:[ribosomal protein S5]-alanine N-acetyltransferase
MRIDLPVQSNVDVALFVLEVVDATRTYADWMSDPLVNRYLESRFATHDTASIGSFIASMLESPVHLFLGIRSHALDRHVGNIKLGPIDRHHGTGEIGLLIGDREAWGRGIATAAIAQLATLAKDRLALRKLTAGCYASNVASRRAFEKAGFVVEGTRPAQFLLDGRPEDLVLLGRLLK